MSMTYDNSKARGAGGPRRRIEHGAVSASLDRCSAGAVLGLAGGIVSGCVGAVLSLSAWFEGTAGISAYLQTAGTVLFVLMIPLLVFGAHCLDMIEKRKKTERESRFKEDE